MISNSELRQDLVSGDWIVITPARARRPDDFIKKKEKRKIAPIKNCPFEDPQKFSNLEPYLIYPNKSSWAVQVFPNKYPVVAHQKTKARFFHNGPYTIFPGVGHHDLVITRDHRKNFPKLNKEEAHLVFQAFRDRYLIFFQEKEKQIAYVSIFHNWGPAAGASIFHPHYQIIAIPVVPPDINHSLIGSTRYFEQHHKCIHCLMIEWEKKEKKRIIYENEGAIAFAPYVSRSPFEVRVFPKKHLPYFENTYDEDIEDVVGVLQKVLKIFEKKLNDPDYNFFIHTSPIKDKEKFHHYHWHIEITPKFSIMAGFELGTGIEINVIDPDQAAKLLRN